jgi:hypothetical protein
MMVEFVTSKKQQLSQFGLANVLQEGSRISVLVL